MSWLLGDERFKKAEGETFHQKGQKVWLVDRKTWTVTTKPRGGKCLGTVVKDSIWPDLWVTVDLWDKEQASAYWNRNIPKEVQEAVKLRTIRSLATRKAKGPRGPYQSSGEVKTLAEAKAWVKKEYGEKSKKRKKMNPMTRALLWIKSKGICHYCGIKTVYEGPANFEKPEPNQFTVDHKIPVSLGGSDSPENLVGSCRDCNHLKRDMTEEEFRTKYREHLRSKGKTNASQEAKA